MIEINKLSKIYGNQKVLNELNFSMNKGDQCVIRGASGSGKSTLLHIIGGLEIPDLGSVVVDDVELSKMNDEKLASYRNRFIGFVFQFHFLLPSMNCLDNILLPSRIGGIETNSTTESVLELASYLGVDSLLKKYPYQISGGEQQRVNIIRALSLKPKLLLCDEPTGNLDSQSTEKVTLLIKKLALELATTLIVVTHDDKVASHFERVEYLLDGRFVQND